MKTTIGMTLLLIGVAGLALAGDVPTAPEINPGSAGTAVALLGGALLVLRNRIKK